MSKYDNKIRKIIKFISKNDFKFILLYLKDLRIYLKKFWVIDNWFSHKQLIKCYIKFLVSCEIFFINFH